MGTLFYFFVKVQICLDLYKVLQEDFRYDKNWQAMTLRAEIFHIPTNKRGI